MAIDGLSFEFFNETSITDRVENELRLEADRRIDDLARGHKDIRGIRVALEELTGDETPHQYQARVTVYARPKDVAAVGKHETATGALKGAMDGVERQVRKRREKLGRPWEQP